jgi:hypothetical protein
MTLLPFEFALPAGFRLVGFTGFQDIAANIVLFVPIGFFAELSGKEEDWPAGAYGMLVAFALTTTIETIQIFEPARSPSLYDIAANTLGGWLGAGAYRAIRRALDRHQHRFGVLALDLPLVGLIYLLVPLLWLGGMASDGSADRLGLSLLVGLAGATILGAIARHHLALRSSLRRWPVPLLAAVWYLLGAVPGWFGRPLLLAAGAAIVAGATALLTHLLFRLEPAERRYEPATIARVLPILGLYVVLLALWSPFDLTARWSLRLGFDHEALGLSNAPIFGLLEFVAAFSVLGYAFAEARGRRAETRVLSLTKLFGLAVALAFGITMLRGFHPRYGASAVEAMSASLAALGGGAVYFLQRAYVRAVVNEREAGSFSPPARAPREAGSNRGNGSLVATAPVTRRARRSTARSGVRESGAGPARLL